MAFKRLSAKSQRAVTRGKIQKLQRAGLLSDKIDASKKPNTFVKAKLYKYRRVIIGKDAAVKVNKKTAADFHKKGYGGEGKIVLIHREKGERVSVTKNDVIKSTRVQDGERVTRTISPTLRQPKPGEKLYYIVPERLRGTGKLKRKIFASYDEMVHSFEAYEVNFEDLEGYIEVVKRSPAREREYAADRQRARRRGKRRK